MHPIKNEIKNYIWKISKIILNGVVHINYCNFWFSYIRTMNAHLSVVIKLATAPFCKRVEKKQFVGYIIFSNPLSFVFYLLNVHYLPICLIPTLKPTLAAQKYLCTRKPWHIWCKQLQGRATISVSVLHLFSF